MFNRVPQVDERLFDLDSVGLAERRHGDHQQEQGPEDQGGVLATEAGAGGRPSFGGSVWLGRNCQQEYWARTSMQRSTSVSVL
mgnify:CR=1 FL=1